MTRCVRCQRRVARTQDFEMNLGAPHVGFTCGAFDSSTPSHSLTKPSQSRFTLCLEGTALSSPLTTALLIRKSC
jgi:hypothetical protein